MRIVSKQKRYVATIASYSKVVVKEEEVGDVRERSTKKEAKAAARVTNANS